MKTLDSLTWHIMDAMADDWESIDQIRPHVHRYFGPASDERIVDVLQRLHGEELIAIMGSEHSSGKAFPADPKGSWFTMSERGRTLWDAQGSRYRDG